jgi:tetratricopeptide (TPR) repeat protein
MSATSSTLDARSVAAPIAAARSAWIVGAPQDLLLFVATPLLVGPILWTMHARWSWEEIALFVGTFGATGHHLPGMMRAYGDRALFRRFRLRFILVPILLVSLSAVSTIRGFQGIVLVSVAWAIWHAMMQTYGFARIYDAKNGRMDSRVARLDLAMCVAWFGFGLLWSTPRLGGLLELFYGSGGPYVSKQALDLARNVWLLATGAVTLAYAKHLIVHWHEQSRVKLLFLFTSFVGWWCTAVTIAHPLVGRAIWELFHDVQYLAIVWLFNLKRVEMDPGVGGFTRFIFRRSGALVGAYVGLVLAYGYFAFAADAVPRSTLKQVLEGVLLASGLLHFYYDGFIWKMREPETRVALGVTGQRTSLGRVASAGQHGLRWALLLAVVLALGVAQTARKPAFLDRYESLVALLPTYPDGLYRYGQALAKEGRREESVARFREALALQPDHGDARFALEIALARSAPANGRTAGCRRAIEVRPERPEGHACLGMALAREGRAEEAMSALRTALRLRPDQVAAHLQLARLLAAKRQTGDALVELRAALQIAEERGDTALVERIKARIHVHERRTQRPVANRS